VRPDVSIVIPAYNPQERIFTRVLKAVAGLSRHGSPSVECVVIDNRSTPPLHERREVQEFLADVPGARVVPENRQGLTFARIAGIRATSGGTIVVLDDDNVPSPSYVEVVTRLIEEYPFVGVWGPGNVDVELLDAVQPWLEQRAKAHHGQKSNRHVQYGCVPGSWHTFYPHGIGQVIRRDVAESFRSAVESGKLSVTDRAGGSLASAGDNQIVWQAINMGLAAGLHPDLRVLHLIPGSRTTIKYLRRLMFGCALSYCQALAQSFPSEADEWRRNVPNAARCGIQLSKVVMQNAVRTHLRFLSVDLAELLGEICGHLSVAGYDNHWTFTLARRLGLTSSSSRPPMGANASTAEGV
jgi:hypothetical protein